MNPHTTAIAQLTDRQAADRMEAVNDRLRARIAELELAVHIHEKGADEQAATVHERDTRIEELRRALSDLLFWADAGEKPDCACERCKAVRQAKGVMGRWRCSRWRCSRK